MRAEGWERSATRMGPASLGGDADSMLIKEGRGEGCLGWCEGGCRDQEFEYWGHG